MEDGLESSTVVTASKSSDSGNISSSTLAYDNNFVRTFPGILIFAEIVFGLLVWTLIGGTEYLRVPAFGWVMFVTVVYWVLTVFFLIIYLTMAHTRITQVPWSTVGLYFNSSATLLYAVAAVVNAVSVSQATKGRYSYNSWVASTIFAFLVALCYAGNAYFSLKSWRLKTQSQ